MRLRQVALVAEDLEATTTRLGRLLGIDYGYHDPGIIGFGLDNWVAAIGDTFLEVVSPVQERTTAGRYLERRGGDGGYMVILQVADLDAARSRLEGAGARIVWNARGEGPNGELTEGLHVHPRDCGGAILSVDRSTPTDSWVWAGPEWREHGSSHLTQICGVELQSADPRAMAECWGGLLGRRHSEGRAPDDRPAWIIDLDEADPTASPRCGQIRFVADDNGRGDGVSAFDVVVRSGEADDDRRWTDEAGVRVFFQMA